MKCCVLLLGLAISQPLLAQGGALATEDAPSYHQWAPLGEVPVDQAGAGRRGYAIAGEGAEVAAPGASQIALHTVAANYFFREQTTDFLITQRYETHTLAIDFRRGFATRILPRVEFGAQFQLSERDTGFLNGLISAFENLCFSVTGAQSVRVRNKGTPLPLGAFVTKDGRGVYSAAGRGAGLSDIFFVAKAMLHDAPLASSGARVAVRIGMNVSGKSEFAEGHYVGVGLSLDKRLLNWVAFHGDARVTFALDRVSQWGLPLKRSSVGFSAGPELRLSRHSSVSVQIDGNTTPYLPTGTFAFDEGYGSITLGLGYRFRAGRTAVVSQIYARENMNLPFRVRWNTDPDASVGIKITLRPRSGTVM